MTARNAPSLKYAHTKTFRLGAHKYGKVDVETSGATIIDYR